MQFDVCIAGGGMSGLLTGCLLSDLGFTVCIIEKTDYNNKIGLMNTITTAIAYGNIEILKRLGIYEIAQLDAGRIDVIEIIDGRDDAPLIFDGLSLSKNPMGYVMHNRNLFNAMLSLLQSKSNVRLISNATCINVDNMHLSDGKYKFNIVLDNGTTLCSKILFIADGCNSKLAELMNFKQCRYDYNQTAVVFNVEHKDSHMNTAVEKFMPNGPIALLPLHQSNTSAIVWTQTNDIARELSGMNYRDIGPLLRYHLPKWIGDVDVISEPSYHSLSLSLRYPIMRNGVVLLGNTLRTLHPIAGQGFNVIMRDIKSLCYAMKPDCTIDDKMYRIKRHLDGMSMMCMTHLTNLIFTNNSTSLSVLRKIAINTVSKTDFLKRFFIRHASGIT